MKLTLSKGEIPPHLLKFFKNITPKPKDDLMIPHRVYQALMEYGWYGRSDVVWNKPNAMPESVRDRPTRAHEYVFLLTKSARYFYDADAIAEAANGSGGLTWEERKSAGEPMRRGFSQNDGRTGSNTLASRVDGTRNRRTVWSIPTQPYSGAHYATMPEALIEPCILAGSSAQACEHCGAAWVRVVEREQITRPRPDGNTRVRNIGGRSDGLTKMPNGVAGVKVTTTGFAPACACENNTGSAASVVLDPFGGSGTVGKVAARFQRSAVLCELNPDYISEHIEKRTDGVQVELFV